MTIPPPIWTLIYLLIAAGFSALAGWPSVLGLPINWLGGALVAVGVALAVSAAMLFRREGTEIKPNSPANQKLVTSGPFRVTRNPMYLSLVMFSTGIAIWVGSWPMFLAPIAAFATFNWVHIPFEEAKMRRQFGAAFEDYSRNVRRWV